MMARRGDHGLMGMGTTVRMGREHLTEAVGYTGNSPLQSHLERMDRVVWVWVPH